MKRTGRALRMAYFVAGLAGIGFFVMSVVLLGYWPGRVLEDQTRDVARLPLGLSVSEQRGRASTRVKGARTAIRSRSAISTPICPVRCADACVGDAVRLPASLGHKAHRARPLARGTLQDRTGTTCIFTRRARSCPIR